LNRRRSRHRNNYPEYVHTNQNSDFPGTGLLALAIFAQSGLIRETPPAKAIERYSSVNAVFSSYAKQLDQTRQRHGCQAQLPWQFHPNVFAYKPSRSLVKLILLLDPCLGKQRQKCRHTQIAVAELLEDEYRVLPKAE
jgi:hypothetical protein